MTSEHRYGVPERLESSNKRNSNFATCLAASPVAISFLCLLVVTPVRSSLSLSLVLFTRKHFGVVTFSSTEPRFRFWSVYTETFLCLHEMTKVLLWSNQNSDEQLSSDDGPDSEREGMKCEGEGRDSECEWEGTDGEGEGWATKAKEQAFVWTDNEVELLLLLRG